MDLEAQQVDFMSKCVWIVRIYTSKEIDQDQDEDHDYDFGSDSDSDSDADDSVYHYSDPDSDSDSDSDDDEEDGRSKKKFVVCLTAFAVARGGVEYGYLLTCSHGNWYERDYKIRVRQLGGDPHVSYDAFVVSYKADCDMCLLKVRARLSHVVTWGNGKVDIGETIYLIGHPFGLLGTLVTGSACYGCTDEVHFDLDDELLCMYYYPSVWVKPAYRIMGHILNASVFDDPAAEKNLRFELPTNYLARLPVIQCCNLGGGNGASGGPVFNKKGQVVGMLLGGIEKYEIAVHVSALQKFVEVSKPKGRGLFKSMREERKLQINLAGGEKIKIEGGEKIEKGEKQPFKKRRN